MLSSFDNVLTETDRLEIKRLADYEIDNHLCLDVPKYQSHENMEIKYKDNHSYNKLVEFVLKHSPIPLKIQSSWFNVCKDDSDFPFHTHEYVDMSAVYFVDGCEGRGTLFKIDGTEHMFNSKNNDLLYFNSSLEHRVPDWSGRDRYTIAFDLKT